MKKSIIVLLYIFTLFLTLSIIFIIKTNFNSSHSDAISVFNNENKYYTIDLNGDHMKDVILISQDTSGADIVISTEDNIISMSTLLNKKIQSPFYLFFEDITADNTSEVIIYDLSEKTENILYVYSYSKGEFKNILEEQCESFGIIEFNDTKKLCITTDEEDYYVFSPSFDNALIKNSFSSLSSILRKDSYYELINMITGSNLSSKNGVGVFNQSTIPSSFINDLAHENSNYLGGYFTVQIDDITFEYSPTEWHSVMGSKSNVFSEYIFRIDDSSISLIKNPK
ncbi:hypothetical protein [Oceanirhabdus seepicola]|uniref:VCBS repeat-containing protein n=1 Tax=Oceanirhabdus seepicola TaxID=2828781 RepID=A0A9J6P2R2_9CLOT|nr:hypothetical protein [Oceanirhabdus seepicola]MCM1990478.1 hypothetical protein [Oceanirhabdus seepicola]